MMDERQNYINCSGDAFTTLSACIRDIVICLSADFIVNEFNHAAESFFGRSADELLGREYTEVFDELGIDLFTTQDIADISKQLPIFDLKCTNRSYDKTKHDVLWSILQLRDLQGSTNGIMLIGRDVSEINQLETQVGRLDNLIKYAPDMIYWKDGNSVHLGCNDRFAAAAGFESRDDVIGKTDDDFPWSDQAEKYKLDDREVIESGETRLNIEDSMPFKNGKQAIVMTNKVPLRDQNNKVIGVLGIATDITELKEIQEELVRKKEYAEAANQAKSEFLATMSHELRTPMNAIMGMAQLMCDQDIPVSAREKVDIILQSSKALLVLINDILDFSKFEAGKINLEIEPFDLRQLVKEVPAGMMHLVKSHEIELIVSSDDSIPEQLLGDVNRVRQILVNLLSNAIKFTEQGFVKFTLKCKTINQNHVEIGFSVEDTGIGIPEDKLEHIFKRFTQVESKYNRRFEGSGLGLAITQQLVKAMNGQVGVKSQLRKGSYFWVTLPFDVPTTDQEKIRLTTSQAPKEQQKLNYRLLLIEDNELNRKVAKMMLEDLGCKLDMAENGFSGLNLYQKNNYDLVFTDIGLPDMDGIQVIRKIREIQNNNRNSIPVIAMTAHVLEEDRENCLDAGADDVLTKPVMQDQLLQILVKWGGFNKIPTKTA